MAALTDAGENLVLDHITTTAPYVALYTVAPTDSTAGTEVTGGSYARELATWAAASGGATSNSADIDFGTASASWGTIVAVGLFTAGSGGTLYAYGALSPNKAVGSGDGFKIPAGSLDITID